MVLLLTLGGNVGEQLVKGVLECDQLVPDGLELDDGIKTLVNAIAVVPDLGLRCIQLQAFFFHQIVNTANHLNVVRSVVADVLFVAFGLDDGELRLPVAQGGLGDSQNLRNITDSVEFFIQFLHGLAQIDRIEYLCGLITTRQR